MLGNMHLVPLGPLAASPAKPAVIRRSTGWAQNVDFTRTPTYEDINVKVRVQAASTQDLRALEQLQIQGVEQVAQILGNYEGVVRDDEKGGDLLLFEGKTYLITAVIERWIGAWCRVGLTQQVAE